MDAAIRSMSTPPQSRPCSLTRTPPTPLPSCGPCIHPPGIDEGIVLGEPVQLLPVGRVGGCQVSKDPAQHAVRVGHRGKLVRAELAWGRALLRRHGRGCTEEQGGSSLDPGRAEGQGGRGAEGQGGRGRRQGGRGAAAGTGACGLAAAAPAGDAMATYLPCCWAAAAIWLAGGAGHHRVVACWAAGARREGGPRDRTGTLMEAGGGGKELRVRSEPSLKK